MSHTFKYIGEFYFLSFLKIIIVCFQVVNTKQLKVLWIICTCIQEWLTTKPKQPVFYMAGLAQSRGMQDALLEVARWNFRWGTVSSRHCTGKNLEGKIRCCKSTCKIVLEKRGPMATYSRSRSKSSKTTIDMVDCTHTQCCYNQSLAWGMWIDWTRSGCLCRWCSAQ